MKIIIAETGCIEVGGHPYWLKADRYQEISAALILLAANRDVVHLFLERLVRGETMQVIPFQHRSKCFVRIRMEIR